MEDFEAWARLACGQTHQPAVLPPSAQQAPAVPGGYAADPDLEEYAMVAAVAPCHLKRDARGRAEDSRAAQKAKQASSDIQMLKEEKASSDTMLVVANHVGKGLIMGFSTAGALAEGQIAVVDCILLVVLLFAVLVIRDSGCSSSKPSTASLPWAIDCRLRALKRC